MHWTRLDPMKVIGHLTCEPTVPEDKSFADQALAHLCTNLLNGRLVAVQDHTGQLFIGTPQEAAEHMLAGACH